MPATGMHCDRQEVEGLPLETREKHVWHLGVEDSLSVGMYVCRRCCWAISPTVMFAGGQSLGACPHIEPEATARPRPREG